MTLSNASISSRRRPDRLILAGLWALAAIAGLLIAMIVAFVALDAAPALRAVGIGRFFTDSDWQPAAGLYGMTPMIVATVLATLGAVLLAAPVGIAAGLFMHYYAPPRIAAPFRRIIQLLAGIPSVVFGLWGLVVLVPLIARVVPPGASLLAAVLVLFLMILPTVALFAEARIGAVPRRSVEGAAALGLGRWAIIRGVVLPQSRGGLTGGVLLATVRALGETMAVLMVAGNVVQIPDSLFAPVRVLTANIALEMAYAIDTHRDALFVSGLLLTGLVAALVLAAARLGRDVPHV